MDSVQQAGAGGPYGIGGLGAGASANCDAGAELGTVDTFNGWGHSLAVDTPTLGGSYDWNSGYKGITATVSTVPMPIAGVYYNKTGTGTMQLS